MSAYYNENNPEAVSWLRELIKMGVIADGIVDDRSIIDVQPEDVREFTQCHWFAGIGLWSYALRLAGIADNQPIWTASLPCQPFSSAGKQLGKNDERHLLPTYINLVEVCRPAIQIGEQVSDAIRHGWLDDIYAEMEALNYAVGSVIAGAHSVYAPHQRQRIYWVADSGDEGFQERNSFKRISRQMPVPTSGETAFEGCGMGNPNSNGRQAGSESAEATRHRNPTNTAGWHDPEWIYCQDGKFRAFKSGIFPLVDGVARGMVHSCDLSKSSNANDTTEAAAMRIRGYGNAIVPQLAAEFIKAFFGNRYD